MNISANVTFWSLVCCSLVLAVCGSGVLQLQLQSPVSNLLLGR